MTGYTVTGNIKKTSGLVDYIADGYVMRKGERVPCMIGFTVCGYTYTDEDRGEAELAVTYIFIKDCVTESGTHYYAETIEI